MIETYRLQKQGGKDFTYLNTRGYHPLLAVIAETGEVVHSWLREGKGRQFPASRPHDAPRQCSISARTVVPG